MNENNVFVLNSGSTNFVLETLNWLEEGLLSLKLLNSDPMCQELQNNDNVELFGVHSEARINVFLNNEYHGNCNQKFLCRIIDRVEIDGVTHFVIEVIKKIILEDLPSMTNSFFTRFFKTRIQQSNNEWSASAPTFEHFGPYR